ncbi:MAG: hypothetical protein WA924_05670 [Burkholderiaceae bacterium]
MKILQISAGRERSVALAENGTAYGWGAFKKLTPIPASDFADAICSSDASEIGHNRFAQPRPHILNPNAPFATVADGYVDTLGVRRGGGVLSCRPLIAPQWGAAHAPVRDLPPGTAQVALTESGAFALQADGTVWSWGMNVHGQLGRATPALYSDAAAIDGLAPIAQIAAGHGHMLALDRDGSVWSWGSNSAGQLGTGSLAAQTKPARVAFPEPIRHVAAGDTHSFALDVDGRLWAWGANNHGQTGDGTERYYTRPVRIKIGFPVAQIDAGMFYTAALSAQGEVFAWGWNGLGQTGRESPASSPQPVRIKPLAHITRIAAGSGHVLATDGAAVFAWGDNRSAACGTAPARAIQPQPLPVSFA